jgi:hypothetical protein
VDLFSKKQVKLLGKIRMINKYINKFSFLYKTNDFDIYRKPASTYGLLWRDRIIEEVTTNSQMLGGRDDFGIPKVVEIDESIFFRAKYNRGNHTIG